MEKARLRRSDSAVLQDQQTGSRRAAPETQLHFHIHSHPDGVGNESILARQRAEKHDMPTDIEDQSSNANFRQLCEIVAKLRAPGGCPWNREQTHESLLPALIEEAYEVAGAVRANDGPNFREELGDLLLLIVMH